MGASASSVAVAAATEDRGSRPGAAGAGGALRDLLTELARLLMDLPADVYRARPASSCGSIGGHVRHALDHIGTLVTAGPADSMCYDHRARGTAVEHDPSAALREIARLEAALDRSPANQTEAPVVVTALLTPAAQPITTWSTLGRELAFVVSHTIHHQAMIALLLEMQGLALTGRRFGYAPSTPTRQ